MEKTMSEPTTNPTHSEIIIVPLTQSETTVNQTINNTQITINSGNLGGHGHHARRAGTHSPAPHTSGQTLTPQVSFAEDGDRLTSYNARDGSSATYRENRQGGGAVTLTLHDANGTLVTHGDRRGYEQTRVDALGHSVQERIGVDTYLRWPTEWGASIDRIYCAGHERDTNVIPAITDSVTRDKIQQFAQSHPELRDRLQHVTLPVTLSGGKQINFGEALAQPSDFRACPTNSYRGVDRK